MAKISRVGDKNQAGGSIKDGAGTVYANGIKVGLHTSSITPHAPFARRAHPPHADSKTTSGSSTVYAEGKPVLKVGSGTTCGHSIAQGSPDIEVP